LHKRLCENVFASRHLFADDTPVPVLDPGRGRTKTGRLWVYAREQRPWSGPEPPAAVYLFAPNRKAEHPVSHLEDFKGVLHVDGYAGFEGLTGTGDVALAACWAHMRREFYEVAAATGPPVAAEALWIEAPCHTGAMGYDQKSKHNRRNNSSAGLPGHDLPGRQSAAYTTAAASYTRSTGSFERARSSAPAFTSAQMSCANAVTSVIALIQSCT
jgi:Transposase IS66 family